MKHLSVRAIALALLLAFCLTGCGTEQSDTKTTDPAESDSSSTTEIDTSNLSDAEKRKLVSDDLKTVDFGDREFNILSRTDFTYEFDSEQTGDVLDDAVYNRNRTVEERFNVKIVTHAYGEGTQGNVLELANKSIEAGDDEYQLLSAYSYLAAPGSLNGLYLNWYDVPNVNFEKPWWENGYIDEASINGVAYLAVGDLSLLFNEVKLAIFFNKNIAENVKTGDLYSLVRDGDWTIDKLIEVSALGSDDLNGDGKMDENDRWGFACNRWTHTIPFLYAADMKMVYRDENGIPNQFNESEKLFDLFEKVYKFINESGDAYICNDGKFSLPNESDFPSDKALFMTSWIGYAANLRNMEADFGIIPYPKWDKEQENYPSFYLDRTDAFLMPLTVDQEFAGTITEALAAESYKQVIPAFYEKALYGKYTRDEESREMLDIILKNASYDFAYIYSKHFGSTSTYEIYRSCIYNKDDSFASKLASVKTQYLALLDTLLESFQ